MGGYFNCNEIKRVKFEIGCENKCGNRSLRLTMNNRMIQWITDNTIYRGEDKRLEKENWPCNPLKYQERQPLVDTSDAQSST